MGYTAVVRYREMPNQMRRHYQCVKAVRALEQELFGDISPSVERDYQRYSWWPLAGPPRIPASLDRPHPPKPSSGGPTEAA